MRMSFDPVEPVRRTLFVRFHSGDEVWTQGDDSRRFDEVLLTFEQNDHTLTLKRILGFGGPPKSETTITTLFNLDDMPIWLNDLAVVARASLFVQITGRSENFSPVFPEGWTDEKRLAYYKKQMENAVYNCLQNGMTREEMEKEYQLDCTIEARAAMQVSNQENVYMQAEIDRLSILVEGLEAENQRLRDVEDVNERLTVVAAEKFDTETEKTKAVKNEVTKLGIRCYSRLRQINQLVNVKALNREPYISTEEMLSLLENWNALGARKVGTK